MRSIKPCSLKEEDGSRKEKIMKRKSLDDKFFGWLDTINKGIALVIISNFYLWIALFGPLIDILLIMYLIMRVSELVRM